MKRFIILAGLIILVFLASLSLAEIPRMINYQGMLTNDSGDPITDTLDLQFRIYNSETYGDLKWSETQNQVPIIDGLFNVILGSENLIDTLSFSEQYWLEVQVDNDTMPERLQFTSVGYAYRARWAERSDTADYALSSPSGPGDYTWTFRITDTADTTISTGGRWGIARYGNTLYGNADSTHVNLGVACTTGTSGQNNEYCTVGGGAANTASGYGATVGGGRWNTASGSHATVGGGPSNTASGHGATVGGGSFNTAGGVSATVGGGHGNTASGDSATVGGGSYNTANTRYATVGGGSANTASGEAATVGGGRLNTSDTSWATVAGGYFNTASGYSATVGGGYYNTASGAYSFAAGRRARANHLGTFVWADSSVNADFASTGNNQFLIRASGGVGIGTANPLRELHIAGAGYTEIMLEKTDATTNKWHIGLGPGRLDFVETDVDERMTLEDGGNVGIGTTDPDARLVISGDGTSWSKGFLFIKNDNNDAGIRLYDRADSVKHHMFNDNDAGDNLRIAPAGSYASGGITIDQSGNVGIGTTNPGTKLSVSGLIGTASYYNVRVNTATGDFYYESLSKRYKEDIQPFEDDFHKILGAEPKIFVDKTSGQTEIGYIAEEFDEVGLGNLVIYDGEGQPNGLRYDLVSLYLLEIMKQFKAENEKLKKRIEALEGR